MFYGKNHLLFAKTVDCPKCGKRGGLNYSVRENTKTKWMNAYAIVTHLATVNSETIHKGNCYLGPVEDLTPVIQIMSRAQKTQPSPRQA
ncbi:MAG: hypothetical protein HYU39_08890 [Thaumarchaeota archaeon]|nr:hypothetical protein [Nitrososphaerota archaeon]